MLGRDIGGDIRATDRIPGQPAAGEPTDTRSAGGLRALPFSRQEVDRIAGYWGPDNFFKMVAYIIARAE